MENDIDTLAIALYVKIDDLLKACPWLMPWRPETGFEPTLSDAELITLGVIAALLGEPGERRWLRRARKDFGHLFPYLPGQSGYNKRLRRSFVMVMKVIRLLAADTSLWHDDIWLVDSTPVPCGCSRETVKRSEVAGWAQYGYCASHSRFFWGLRLHLLCTPAGLPIMFALTGAKADERETLIEMLDSDAELVAGRPGQTIIGDKNYFGRIFEDALTERDLTLLRPTRKGERQRSGKPFLKPLRQIIESINQTFKGQLDLERHAGRTEHGVIARVMIRILALTAAVWHNDQTGQSIKRPLLAHDH